jgi:hypothetical protein
MANLHKTEQCFEKRNIGPSNDAHSWIECTKKYGGGKLEAITHGENPNIGLFKTVKENTLPKALKDHEFKKRQRIRAIGENTIFKIDKLLSNYIEEHNNII